MKWRERAGRTKEKRKKMKIANSQYLLLEFHEDSSKFSYSSRYKLYCPLLLFFGNKITFLNALSKSWIPTLV